MLQYIIVFCLSCLLFCCANNADKHHTSNTKEKQETTQAEIFLTILGTIQDAGSPHIACKKSCCKDLFENPDITRQVVSLGVVDNLQQKKYLFEATPDIARQLKTLKNTSSDTIQELVDGIFLTHAHIGHYAGLMYLGKEATNADKVPVYAMPRMKEYIETNGPWSQLVEENNISLRPLQHGEPLHLTTNLQVIPFLVPHRDEFSETVGYKIIGPSKSALFIPDINKWEVWKRDIIDEIAAVDYAFLDATFYSGKEINNRDISQIPHPFIIESLELFEPIPAVEKAKIHFIHFNHTNPVINQDSEEAKIVLQQGYNIGTINTVFSL